MAKKKEPAWATRLRDLLNDFKAAKKRCRLRFVLIQTTGADIKDLEPSDAGDATALGNPSVTLGDGTRACRLFYRFGLGNDPAVPLIERGNNILVHHGDEIFNLFGLKFVRTPYSHWLWLLDTLQRVPHPFKGDMQVERTLAGHLSSKQTQEAIAFLDGRGPKPNWWVEKHRSFRADIPHVAVASIAAIRAILERVDANAAGTPPTAKTSDAEKQSPSSDLISTGSEQAKTPDSEQQPPKKVRRLNVQKVPGSERRFRVSRERVTVSAKGARILDAVVSLQEDGETINPKNVMLKAGYKLTKDERKTFEDDKGRLNKVLIGAIEKGLYVKDDGEFRLQKPPTTRNKKTARQR